MPRSRRVTRWLLVSLVGLAFPVLSMQALAPVEARVPFAPAAWLGSDGLTHLAYELHVTNIYGDTGALRPQGLLVYGDDVATPLVVFSAA
ncbi:MAG TPA: hypothetical protein VGV14_15440, partial [Rhodanobacter sp.]|nr:hypothetical protein [Rhodanobacter sp.]